MDKIILWLLSVFLLTLITPTKAQSLSATILDSTSKTPIPYATIKLRNKGVITNEEGRFSLNQPKDITENDSLFISCIGYKTIGAPLKEFTNATIYLQAKAIELNAVIVTNKNYAADEIIDLVEENLNNNYDQNLNKKRIFFRDSYFQDFSKMNYTFLKSTIPELNKRFLDSVMQTLPKKSSYYTEVLCDLYGAQDPEKQKIKLIKASELYDKSKEVDYTKLEEKFNAIIKKNIKTDSYFKIKSGWFGTKIKEDEMADLFQNKIDSSDATALKAALEKKKKQEKERKTNFSKYRKRVLATKMKNLFFTEDSRLNMIHKSRKYNFNIQEFTYVGDAAVYIITFASKGSADYKGTIYVNADDFAVIRLDYENIKPLKKYSLLGISMNNFLGKGKLFFDKNESNKYQISYFEETFGTRVGIKRPLKIIEKNKHVKGRNKQNELSVEIDFSTTEIRKHEVVIFNSEKITDSQYDTFKEKNDVLPTYMSAYNPSFWEGHSIIEPNQAIKSFTVDPNSQEQAINKN